MTEDQIESIINRVVTSQAIEGFVVTEESKELMRKIIRGETTVEVEVAKIVEKYKKED